MAPKPGLDRRVVLLLLGTGATIAYLVVQCLQSNFQLHHTLQQLEEFEHRVKHLERRMSHNSLVLKSLDPGDSKVSGRGKAMEEDISDLAAKVNSFISWGQDPYLSNRAPVKCANHTNLKEYGCTAGQADKYCPGLYDNHVCLDSFPFNNCVVYDFGIRAQPEFGKTLLNPPFNCEVFAFDPSPVSVQWYESSDLRDHPRYHFYPFGAGGTDGQVELAGYSWGQVSIVKYPRFVAQEDGKTVNKIAEQTRDKKLPVKTLGTIMKELGHSHIDVLKVDTEGSEYPFLEDMIDSGLCKRIDQIALEWHHYDFDARYGGGASPHLNVVYKMLEKKCGLEQFWVHDDVYGGWLASESEYDNSGMILRYNLGSFMRKEHAKSNNK